LPIGQILVERGMIDPATLKRLLATAGPVAAFPPSRRVDETSRDPERPRASLVYYMLPPWLRPGTPLSSEWVVNGTYDTAAACEAEKDLARSDLQRVEEAAKVWAAPGLARLTPSEVSALRRAVARTQGDPAKFRQYLHLGEDEALPTLWFYFHATVTRERVDAAQCIASNDPRLQRP